MHQTTSNFPPFFSSTQCSPHAITTYRPPFPLRLPPAYRPVLETLRHLSHHIEELPFQSFFVYGNPQPYRPEYIRSNLGLFQPARGASVGWSRRGDWKFRGAFF